MQSAEEIFYKEFMQMMYKRRGINNMFSVYNMDVPSESLGRIVNRDMLKISGVSEEYYSKLNETEAMLWSHGKLARRKYDYKGEYIKENGRYVTQEVTLPHECVAVISPIKIGVPTKYKPKEKFEYVDCIHRKLEDGTTEVRYVYIVPRNYCYKLNQTALVMSQTKLRSFYAGSSVSLTNGHIIYLYIIPYKPRLNTPRNYRILSTKTDIDYNKEIGALFSYWLSKGYIFPMEICRMDENTRGRTNMSIEEIPPSLDEYVRYNPDVSLAKVDTISDMWEDGNAEFSEEV